MSTRLLLASSAILLGVVGAAASFAPAELLAAAGGPTAFPLPLVVQLLGAALFAFGLANWTAKDSLYGGIYARPLALGNAVHFTMGALTLARAAFRSGGAALPAIAAVWALFAVFFLRAVFGNPLRAESGAAAGPVRRD
jgi:hypothetical protein